MGVEIQLNQLLDDADADHRRPPLPLPVLLPGLHIPLGELQPSLVENFMAAQRGHKNFRMEVQPRPAAQGSSEDFGHESGPKTSEPSRLPAQSSFPTVKLREAMNLSPIACQSFHLLMRTSLLPPESGVGSPAGNAGRIR